jgi:hypothetical protein
MSFTLAWLGLWNKYLKINIFYALIFRPSAIHLLAGLPTDRQHERTFQELDALLAIVPCCTLQCAGDTMAT